MRSPFLVDFYVLCESGRWQMSCHRRIVEPQEQNIFVLLFRLKSLFEHMERYWEMKML